MKFPSVHALAQTTLNVCRRFPLTILFILLACLYNILYNHHSVNYGLDLELHPNYYRNIIWSAYLGMLISLVIYI